ncbi:atrial natriuretic peptide receptor 1-like [Asterias rubens]|uniref:atrial natriuretic peptide receptor 1-like n=1 Tax=Asterias rubens TaxID=7604 RepID=UPI001455C52E|nr:atrial natriuretic peptide receptor 1-like [Asterias rubens]
MGRFAVALFKKWSWTRCSIIWNDTSIWKITATSVKGKLEEAGIYINPVVLGLQESNQAALDAAVRRGRIIFIITPVEAVRDIMLKAYRAGYINGEYVFFSVHLFNNTWRFGDSSWQQGDGQDAEAKQAFEALMTFRLLEPITDKYKEFRNELQLRRKRVFNWTSPPGDDYNFFTNAFHDVIILFSLAVNETLSDNGNLSDGLALTRKMRNRTFEGISGLVTVNENGDRDADYSLWDMTDTSKGQFTVVYDFYGATGELRVTGDIVWPGGASKPPLDTPECGFDNENPACHHQDSSVSTTIVIACSIVAIAAVIILGVYRKLKKDAEIQSRAWQIKWEELQFQSELGRVPTSSTFSIENVSVRTEEGRQIFTKTAFYQGHTVAVKRLDKDRIDLKRNLLIELKNMRHVGHPNLARFIGLCVDVPNVFIVNEYCPKGSLMDILQNDSINLDWLFKYSLISDVIKGVQYLHRSALSVHGRLNSSNCLIDSRFVLKLTDFGLHTLREGATEAHGCHAVMTKCLWIAPELLREPKLSMTKEGDIYSIGIVMKEIVTREGPYDAESKYMDMAEILEKIRAPPEHGPVFRPRESEEKRDPNLSELMKACWAEEPRNRPTANTLRSSMDNFNREKNTGTNILDNLLNRMEQYANNLEELVEERTSAFLEEKKRADMLLYELLPRVVANQLKLGKSVDPETYDNVTIFFSDIQGFTALSAQSTPMQIVVFLNDLYTCFDGIIGGFDVYKVETIGDAYMVVSGVPVRNGETHAREIGNMALALLEAVCSFKIRHKNEMKLQLRVGIHTGPCVAGVVGLKMPRYCLFGDTVNTASRMESNGEALKIHISSETKKVLESFHCFDVQLRGSVEMKGKGIQTTYWLLGSDDRRCQKSITKDQDIMLKS